MWGYLPSAGLQDGNAKRGTWKKRGEKKWLGTLHRGKSRQRVHLVCWWGGSVRNFTEKVNKNTSSWRACAVLVGCTHTPSSSTFLEWLPRTESLSTPSLTGHLFSGAGSPVGGRHEQNIPSHVLGAVTCRQQLWLMGTSTPYNIVQKADQDMRRVCKGLNKCLGQTGLTAVLLSLHQPSIWQGVTGCAGCATGRF